MDVGLVTLISFVMLGSLYSHIIYLFFPIELCFDKQLTILLFPVCDSPPELVIYIIMV